MGQKYAYMKQQILAKNQADYEQTWAQRKDCLEKKYEIIQENTLRLREKYQRQKSQEIRLKQMYSTLKTDRLNKNKSRYDDQTIANTFVKDQHNARLEAAAKREQLLIARMANTMNTQKQAMANLEDAIKQSKIKKSSRVEPLDV